MRVWDGKKEICEDREREKERVSEEEKEIEIRGTVRYRTRER